VGRKKRAKIRCIVVASLERLLARHVVLDGELVVVDENGRSDFDVACDRLKREHGPAVTVYVFDVLALEGEDLRGQPLRERKRALADVRRSRGLEQQGRGISPR